MSQLRMQKLFERTAKGVFVLTDVFVLTLPVLEPSQKNSFQFLGHSNHPDPLRSTDF